jgi:gluconate 2-dehydrogenase gamma chain
MNKSRQTDLNFSRRDGLRYALGLMAAAGADPQVVDAWMQHVEGAGHSSSDAAGHRKFLPLAEGNPSFFNPGEYKTLVQLVDLIIPPTDTPGAAAAGVPLYIDIVVNLDPAVGAKFRKGLSELDASSRQANNQSFAEAGQPAQTQLLQSMLPENAPGHDFFETVKAMTIVGYYSSEIGLFQELHFLGNQALSSFPGCPHGGHPLDVPGHKKVARAIEDPARRWPFPSSDNITQEDL